MAGRGTTARGFSIFLGVAFLSLLWDMGGLVRLQQYVQSEVSILSNWGAHFTCCSFKNPPLQGVSCPLTHMEVSYVQCRQDNRLPHESFVASSSRAMMR